MDEFEVTSGTLILSDPCYEIETWCTVTVPAEIGTWIGFVNRAKDTRIAELIVVNKEFTRKPESFAENWKLLDGEVGVDSGQAGVFDLAVYPQDGSTGEHDDENSFYGQCCKVTLDKTQGRAGKVNGGFVASSGYGDGGYDAYAIYDDRNNAVAIKIVFIPESYR